LVNLCKYFEINQNTTLEHSAEYDSEMTIKLLKQLIKLNSLPLNSLPLNSKKRKLN
jgi:DNA polymerase III epsilon subunit-like protein